jgi:hypothetical protein
MARRRVFQIKVECPGIGTDLGRTANKQAIVGRTITFEKSASTSEVAVCLDGAAVGRLDDLVGSQVASAIDRGQLFTVVIKNAYQNYTDQFKPTTALLYLKVEYLLEKGQPAIEVPNAPVQTDHFAPKSFFTKVAGVTFENRQQVVARCAVGERLILIRDPTDRFDKGAIKVMRLNGEQLGFISAHVSRGGDPSGLAFQMDRGDNFQCRIKDLTGGGGWSLGVNIEITEGQEFASKLSTARTPAPLSVSPIHSNLGWLFAAAALILLVVVLIMHGWS